jgi:histidinol-phosphate aminotransferase
VVVKILAAKERLVRIALDNGLNPLPSGTNFVTMDCGRDGAFAKALMDTLIERDVFLRKPAGAPQDRCIRISSGPGADIDIFAAELPAALASLRR